MSKKKRGYRCPRCGMKIRPGEAHGRIEGMTQIECAPGFNALAAALAAALAPEAEAEAEGRGEP